MAQELDILAVGSVAYDDVDSPQGSRQNQLGGSVVFFSLAASNFAKVGITAIIGSDFEDEHKHFLSSRGIDIDALEQVDGATMRWHGSYVADLNNAVTLDVKLNVFEQFQPALSGAHATPRALFLGNIAPAIQLKTLQSMQKRPALVMCDTMNLWIETQRTDLTKLFEQVDGVVINEAEALSYTRTDSVAHASVELLKHGLKYALIKRGEYGSALFTPDFQFAMPAFPLQVVSDPTGAGDSFAGGFMGALARCKRIGTDDLRRAVVIGSTMASFTVAEFGTDRLAHLTKADISTRYNQFQSLTQFGDYDFGE